MQYDYGDDTVHMPKGERRSRKWGDESKYSKVIIRERGAVAIREDSSLG